MSKQLFIERPPRIQPELPSGEIEIPALAPGKGKIQPFWQLLLPALGILGYLFISLLGGSNRIFFIIPIGLGIGVTIVMGRHNSEKARKEREARRDAYRETLGELRRDMLQKHDMQRRFFLHNYPSVKQTMEIAEYASRLALNPHIVGDDHRISRLWERRTSDNDFGIIRLGIGEVPSRFIYHYQPQTMEVEEEANLDRQAVRLAEESCYVSDIPIILMLRGIGTGSEKKEGVSPCYALGVAGTNLEAVYGFSQAIVVHYVTFHSPSDAQLLVLGLESAEQRWKWVGALPHVVGDNCFETEADIQTDQSESRVVEFLKRLRKILDERHLRLQDQENQVDVTLPFLLLVVDLLGKLSDQSRLKDLEADPAISLIMSHGEKLGIAVVFLVPSVNQVPSGCLGVVELTVDAIDQDVNLNQEPIVRFRYSEIGVNSPRFMGIADVNSKNQILSRFATVLEPLTIRKSYGADLPKAVHIMDMLKVTSMEEMHQLIRKNWGLSKLPPKDEGKIKYEKDYSGWIRCTLGMLSGGDYRTLVFSADEDGVHGMIAGSTGSGKSELLMTMILDMAAKYDPAIVNFVLVDFKGGGAFEPLKNLPHVVDVVTNLNQSAVERMFASIKAELDRRSALNTRTNMKHIVEYRKYRLHEPDNRGNYGKRIKVKDQEIETEPYPHLFIFIDEFAEMISNNPEYKDQLNSITRLGRALGVTLILAAQRPTGVTDQMRANIKFRIALRVETREESSEILRRPDATYLPTGVPGRGYLQVGNENIEMIQVAWSGAEYKGKRETQSPDVIWLKRQNQANDIKNEESRKVYEEMVRLMGIIAEVDSIKPRKPWPNFLPEKISLQTIFDDHYLEDKFQLIDRSSAQGICLNREVAKWINIGSQPKWTPFQAQDWQTKAMRAVVGLVDNPYNAEQLPLIVDFRQGHGVVFGASGWGKTVFLRTTLISLAVSHSPNELNIYILDLSGLQMKAFEGLPHVGAVITADEDERIKRLLRKLTDSLDIRKKKIADSGVTDLYEFNAQYPNEAMAAILVLIENFAEFRENYEPLLPPLISLVRESRAYGIHFLVSAELPNSITGKLYSLLTERYALKLSDPTEYAAIVGRGGHVLDEIPGRGFVQFERRALEFQVALPLPSDGESRSGQEGDMLRTMLRQMTSASQTISNINYPFTVETLPDSIDWRKFGVKLPLLNRPKQEVSPVLAIQDDTLQPWRFNLKLHGPHALLIGPPNSGKTTTLQSLILAIAYEYTPQEAMFVLCDFQSRLFNYGGQFTLGDLPHVVGTISSPDDMVLFVEQLRYECEQNAKSAKQERRAIFVIIDNYELFSEEVSTQKTVMSQLTKMAREYGTAGLHFVISGAPEILRLTDDLRKQIWTSRYAIALDVESVQRTNGKVPRSILQDELPMGRAFIVKSGRTSMLQFATYHNTVKTIVESLDESVLEISDHYARTDAKVKWQYLPPIVEQAEVQNTEQRSSEPVVPPSNSQSSPEQRAQREQFIPSKGVPKDVDIKDLRQKLILRIGKPMVDMMEDVNVYDTAVKLKLL